MGWLALVSRRAASTLAAMRTARRTEAWALLLALVLLGCDDGGAEDGVDVESDAASASADDGGTGLDGGGPLDARAPAQDDRTVPMDMAGRDGAAESLDAAADARAPIPAQGDAEVIEDRDAAPASSGDASSSSDAAIDAASEPGIAADASVQGDAEPSGDAAQAAVDASAPESDAAIPACVATGERCDRASCCEGVCVRDVERGGATCAPVCQLPDRCEGCGPYCGATQGVASRCQDAVLIARDGTYLGEAVSAAFDSESVCNPNGMYGSNWSRVSIYNRNGPYGSSFGPESAYNASTLSAPAIACRESAQIIGYVSKNMARPSVVDPDGFCAWLRQRGM